MIKSCVCVSHFFGHWPFFLIRCRDIRIGRDKEIARGMDKVTQREEDE